MKEGVRAHASGRGRVGGEVLFSTRSLPPHPSSPRLSADASVYLLFPPLYRSIPPPYASLLSPPPFFFSRLLLTVPPTALTAFTPSPPPSLPPRPPLAVDGAVPTRKTNQTLILRAPTYRAVGRLFFFFFLSQKQKSGIIKIEPSARPSAYNL